MAFPVFFPSLVRFPLFGSCRSLFSFVNSLCLSPFFSLSSSSLACWRCGGVGIWANLSPTKSSISVWARPGPDSRAGPESVWPTNTSEMGQNQPGPVKGTYQCWARTGLAQHWKTNQWGELFSPYPPACRTNILHAGGKRRKPKEIKGEEKCT